MHPEWARSLRDQCAEANRWVPQVPGAAGVSFHFKQVGGRTAKAGGRELDGREWNEFPSVVGGA
jgi:protein gp37